MAMATEQMRSRDDTHDRRLPLLEQGLHDCLERTQAARPDKLPADLALAELREHGACLCDRIAGYAFGEGNEALCS